MCAARHRGLRQSVARIVAAVRFAEQPQFVGFILRLLEKCNAAL
jgi:hypothetical protein